MTPTLELLYELDGLPAFELPAALASAYGGTLGFDEPRVFANFVSSLDGVVAIPALKGSNRLIAKHSSADRFVMGLLRACSDAVMIGSGTLAGSPGSLWTPTRAFPDASDGFDDLRRRLGRPPNPELVVVSARGLVDPGHPALVEGALVITTDLGAARLAPHLSESVTVLSLGTELEPGAVIAALSERGHRLILSEGGPHAVAPLLGAGLVDELFLTFSPLLVGRGGSDERLGLVEGADQLVDGPLEASLLSVRSSGDHLFLRYALERG